MQGLPAGTVVKNGAEYFYRGSSYDLKWLKYCWWDIMGNTSDFFTCASRVPYSHFCFGTHILNLSESQDLQSYSGKFCNGRNDFLVGLILYSPSESWDA